MIIATLTYVKPIEEIDAFLDEHRILLEDLCHQRIIVCSGPQNPRTGGIIMLNAANADHANEILSADPFMREGLATYSYVEFTPVKCAPEFTVFLGDK